MFGGAFGIPKWDPNLYFTQDVIIFIAGLVCLVTGILICFWGYKYLFTLVQIVFGAAAGVLGMHWLDGRLKYPVLALFMLVAFIFLGECLLLAVSMPLREALKRGGLIKGARTFLILMSPLFGAALVFGWIYLFVSTDPVVCAVPSAVLLIAGAIHQKKAKVNRPVFHTYDEIYEEVRRDA